MEPQRGRRRRRDLLGELEEGDVAMISGEAGEIVVDAVSSGSRVA